ncbi:MAG TPA: site-specific integrase [Bellilinea sp.]|nr:site-specific integrase [Bellilinea sp.]
MLSTIYEQGRERYESLPLLGPVWNEFCGWLAGRGYPPKAIRRRIQAGYHLEARLQQRGVTAWCEITGEALHGVVAPRPRRWTDQLIRALTKSLVEFLDEQGRLARPAETPTDQRLANYRRYLVYVRGLAPATVERHDWRIRDFLEFLNFDSSPSTLADVTINRIDEYITREGCTLGRASMQKVCGILRSFLRFSSAAGSVTPGLDTQIDSPRCYRQERLPRALPWTSVRRLLDSVDRTNAKGRRDYAMLLLIATYGLRSGEIAALRLEDFIWRARQIRVPRPKIGSPLVLPLTDEVVVALVDYFRNGRPPTSSCREAFLRGRVPGGPIKSYTVNDAFDFWAKRAGLELPEKGSGGPHCLRHSLAMHLLRTGASVKAIGEVLGHRNIESTSIYLRLHVEDLRSVALSLPGFTEVKQ